MLRSTFDHPLHRLLIRAAKKEASVLYDEYFFGKAFVHDKPVQSEAMIGP